MKGSPSRNSSSAASSLGKSGSVPIRVGPASRAGRVPLGSRHLPQIRTPPKIAPCQEHAIYIIRLPFIRDKTAIDNEALYAGTSAHIDKPTQGFGLSLPQFWLSTKTTDDFFQSRPVNSRRQVTLIVEFRDHQPAYFWLS
jgi:hypothetical protein